MLSRTQTSSLDQEPVVTYISLAKLDECWDIANANVWNPGDVLTGFMVEDARLSGDHLKYSKPWSCEEDWTTRMHCCRIAYLMECGWDDPIELVFDWGAWPCQDGNHRLKAAFFRGDRGIKAVCYGLRSVHEKFVLNANE